ncbi:HIRA-interacting protein 3-like [Portunus trituberculatus]|uniref:HIRA-interacting protein 3-like n=1 Tax=Portunus trituberculatus TaxID=210409 RepID=UPI001E1D1D50|nr:HIRA-interacting protein 3-like [Portunus trituberculatus]
MVVVKSRSEGASSKLSSKSQKGKKKTSQASKTSKEKDPLAQLKKYLMLMGIRNWWLDSALKRCSSIKSKKARLLEMMEENGLKGRPTVAKCKKAKAKRERQKELEELDKSNILTESGRGRRNVFSLYAKQEEPKETLQSPAKPSRAKPILESDSESSANSGSESRSESRPESHSESRPDSGSD